MMLELASLVTGGVQSLMGGIQSIGANKKLNKLASMRTAYKTPKEIYDQLNAAQYNAQTGFSDQTMNYLSGQNEKALSSSTGAALRLGADPNLLASMTDSFFDNAFKVGSESNIAQMKNLDRWYDSKKMLADSLTAEWQSKENLIKDQMQNQTQKAQAGQANMQSGLNLAMSGLAAMDAGNMYGEELKPKSSLQSEGYVSPMYGSANSTYPSRSNMSGLKKRSSPNINLSAIGPLKSNGEY